MNKIARRLSQRATLALTIVTAAAAALALPGAALAEHRVLVDGATVFLREKIGWTGAA